MKLFFLVLFSIILTVRCEIDYCKIDCRGAVHVACNKTNNQWGIKCPNNKSQIYFDGFHRNFILKLFNEKRNTVAGGMVTNFPKACRMATIQWNNELAHLAGFNVRQCEVRHEKCRNTNTFKYSGQNIAKFGSSEKLNPVALIKQAVNLWYDEYKETKREYIDKFPSNFGGTAFGHFAIMVNERNTRMGCALASYKSSKQSPSLHEYLLTCNFATTNMITRPIYKSCTTAGEKCKTGSHPDFPNLCSVNEKYNVNTWN